MLLAGLQAGFADKAIPTQKPRPAGKCTHDEESMSGRQGEAEWETVLRVCINHLKDQRNPSGDRQVQGEHSRQRR